MCCGALDKFRESPGIGVVQTMNIPHLPTIVPLSTVASKLALLAYADVRFFGSTEMGFQHV
jgi:hypothetical protein